MSSFYTFVWIRMTGYRLKKSVSTRCVGDLLGRTPCGWGPHHLREELQHLPLVPRRGAYDAHGGEPEGQGGLGSSATSPFIMWTVGFHAVSAFSVGLVGGCRSCTRALATCRRIARIARPAVARSHVGLEQVKMCTELYGKEAVQQLVKENSEMAKREPMAPVAVKGTPPPQQPVWSPKADLLDLESTPVQHGSVQHGSVPLQVDDLAEIFANAVPEKSFGPFGPSVEGHGRREEARDEGFLGLC